jgi:hypothetical protein
MPKILDRYCSQSYSWETACLFKVHIDREPSREVRMAMMVVSKYHIKDVYKIRTEELESELRQALNNNDKHLSALVQEQLEGIKKWLDEEINLGHRSIIL